MRLLPGTDQAGRAYVAGVLIPLWSAGRLSAVQRNFFSKVLAGAKIAGWAAKS